MLHSDVLWTWHFAHIPFAIPFLNPLLMEDMEDNFQASMIVSWCDTSHGEEQELNQNLLWKQWQSATGRLAAPRMSFSQTNFPVLHLDCIGLPNCRVLVASWFYFQRGLWLSVIFIWFYQLGSLGRNLGINESNHQATGGKSFGARTEFGTLRAAIDWDGRMKCPTWCASRDLFGACLWRALSVPFTFHCHCLSWSIQNMQSKALMIKW